MNKKRQLNGGNQGGNLQQRRQRWEKPDAGVFKLNVDATVKEDQNFYSMGMVLRDSQGRFIAGKTKKVAGAVKVVEAETTAILEGLIWLEELPIGPVIIESDSLLSVNAINKNHLNFQEIGNMVQHCKEIMRCRGEVSVVFGRKHVNKVAHKLAKFPCELNNFVVDLSPPLYLLETLVSDAMIC